MDNDLTSIITKPTCLACEMEVASVSGENGLCYECESDYRIIGDYEDRRANGETSND